MEHTCKERVPECLCNTCQNDVGACCVEWGSEPAPGGCIVRKCPGYCAEPTSSQQEKE